MSPTTNGLSVPTVRHDCFMDGMCRIEGLGEAADDRKTRRNPLGRWCDAHLEADHIGLHIVILGVTFEGESHRRQAFGFGICPGRAPATIDTKCGDTEMPVRRLVVEEKLDSQPAQLALLI